MANNYSDTVLLPRTSFPLRHKDPESQDQAILAQWQREGAYQRMRKARKGENKFVVHSGPPYANGEFHAGHVLPNVLKSMAVQSMHMAGFDTPYRPGSDAHGLPIEWAVELELRQQGRNKNDIPRDEFLQLCRDYASGWIERQMRAWQKMGGQADWKNPYNTMAPQTEVEIYKVFLDVARSGLLRRGNRPVMWSVVEKTSLAEAEIEYKDINATSCYFSFPVEGMPETELVAWTTTPWSIPCNKAVAVSSKAQYALIKTSLEGRTKKYLVAKDRLEEFVRDTNLGSYTVEKVLDGKYLTGKTCRHPLFAEMFVPVLDSSHVTLESGTGIVHIAPAHGPDDFKIGEQNQLDLTCYIDGDGRYISGLPVLHDGSDLTGMSLKEAEKLILSSLEKSQNLLATDEIRHSHPVSWRSKGPLIYRTEPQWFIEMDTPFGDHQRTLRQQALANIDDIEWFPGSASKETMQRMVSTRPDWCISRQRQWGVPIAVFKNKKTGEYVFDRDVMEHIASTLEKTGVFSWYDLSVRELIPKGWLEHNNLKEEDLEKERDILDVWFDSGASFSYVLQNHPSETDFPADLYLEGRDQFRGWFMSSLLLSTIKNGVAPYKRAVAHSFVVNKDGTKLSKSARNGNSAEDLIKKYGADTVRIWVASCDIRKDLKLSDEHFKAASETYFKIRNSIRYMLGNFDSERDAQQQLVEYNDLPELEKYVLAKAYQSFSDIREAYDKFQYNRALREITQLCTDLSGFYFDVRKDSLYCDAPDSLKRRATITTMSSLFNDIVTHAAPLIPFMADEAWRERYGPDAHVYTEKFPVLDERHNNQKVLKKWDEVIGLRSQVSAQIEMLRKSGTPWARKNSGIVADIKVSGRTYDLLEDVDLSEIFMMSDVNLVRKPYSRRVDIKLSAAEGDSCGRCWNVDNNHAGDLCERCDNVVSTMRKGPA